MVSQHNSTFKVLQYSQLRYKARLIVILFILAFSGQLFAALNIAVEVTSSPSLAGEMVVVRLTATNPSATVASNVRIEMLYPDNLNSLFTVALSDGGDCTLLISSGVCNNGETAFWDLGDLSPGSGKTVYLTPTIAAGASDGVIIDFTAQGFENGSLQATANQSIEVQSNQVLKLAIDANQEPVATNSELIYDIVYSQVGDVAITDTVITLPLPAGTSFVSANGGGSLVGSDVVWNIGVLNPGQAGYRRVKIQLDAGIVNGDILSIDAATITGIANFIPQQAQVIETTRVDDTTKIDFALTTNTNPIRRNDSLYTHLTVTNKTTQVMTGVRVELFYPNGLLNTFDFNISDNGDCTGSTASSCNNGETVFWDIGDLQPGAGKTVYIVPTVSFTAANVDGLMLPFIARAMTNSSGDHWHKSTIVIEDSRMLNIAINAKQEPVAPNAQLVYDIIYSHTGDTATTDTQLKLPLPAGTSFISADAGGNLVGNDIIWDIGILNPGQKGHRRLTLQLDSDVASGDIIVVDALMFTGEANFVTHQAMALAATRVENMPQLDLAIAINSNSATNGELIYTNLTITNKTNTVMTGVRLELFYPKELFFMATQRISDGGECASGAIACVGGDTIYWDLPNLNPGTGKTVYLPPIPSVITLGSTDGTLIPFIARAFADNTTERWERNTVILEENRLLNLNVVANQEPVASNQQLKYDITYSNQGDVATTDTELIFTLPNNTTFVAADAGGNLVGNDVIWDIGILNPGQGAHKQVTVQLDASVTNGDIIETDVVTLTGEENLTSHQARALATTRVEDAPAIGLAISTNNDPTRLDEFSYVHLTVTNKTTQLMTGVRIEMLTPFGLGVLINSLTDNGNCISASGTCQSGDTIFWELGSLAPGTGKTVSFTPTIIQNSLFDPVDGQQLSFIARAFADGKTDRWERSTIIIEENRALNLAIDADQEPNIIDASLSYNLTFGNRGDTTANAIELRFPLPDNSTFISAEAGGMLVNNEVIWNIGTLNPGEGSRRRVTLQLNNSISAGDIMEINKASISTVNHKTLASSILRVKHNNVLDLWLDLDANVALPNTTFDANLRVDNQSAATMPNVDLSLFFPNHLNQLADNLISNGGDCNNVAINSNFTCDTIETVVWNLGNMLAGSSSLQNIPPTVEPDSFITLNGAVVQFYAKAQNTSPDRSYVSRSLLIGTFVPATTEPDLIFIDGFE